MEQNFHENFQVNVTWFFAFFYGVLDWIVLILEWSERSIHSAQVGGQSCSWQLKLMMSKVVESMWTRSKPAWVVTGGSGANGLSITKTIYYQFYSLPWHLGKLLLACTFSPPKTWLALITVKCMLCKGWNFFFFLINTSIYIKVTKCYSTWLWLTETPTGLILPWGKPDSIFLVVFFSFFWGAVDDWFVDCFCRPTGLFDVDFPLNLASPWPFLRNVLWGFCFAFSCDVFSSLEALTK